MEIYSQNLVISTEEWMIRNLERNMINLSKELYLEKTNLIKSPLGQKDF